MAFIDALISPAWLAENIDRPDVKILDGTWIMPSENPVLADGYIPGAQFFDIDEIADTQSAMKHMLPSAAVFEAATSKLGIHNSDTVIVYDRHGVRTSPRLWWTFRMFGHENVAVLDGGLPGWIDLGLGVAQSETRFEPATYSALPSLSAAASLTEILASLDYAPQILDARPEGRFFGMTPEPRAGLRSGHIPGSQPWPYGGLMSGGKFTDLDKIKIQLEALNIDLSKPIVTTCGSGITAAGLAFALHRLGAKEVSVYDGSWAEWGASNAPISLGN